MLVSCFNSQFFDSETSYSSAKSEIMRGLWFSGRQVKIVSQNKYRGWSFDSKPILLWLQLYADATGNAVRCLQLSMLKLGLELKQKYPPKSQILNNSYPTFLERLNIYFFRNRSIREFVVAWLTVCRFLFFRDREIREFVVARLQVCRVLVLTHNFEMKRPVER